MIQDDLLEQASHLATRDRTGKPKQANLRRGVSSAYYALFHLLVTEASSRLLARKALAGLRGGLARQFSHEGVKAASRAIASGGTLTGLGSVSVPADLKKVAQAVVDLQQARHDADYDLVTPISRREALDFVNQAKEAFDAWHRVRKSEPSELYLLLLLAYKGFKDRP